MRLLLLFTLFIGQFSFAQMDSINVDGIFRKYLVHLPTGYDGTTDLPVVLGFHGALRDAVQFEEQSLFSEKADEENFIVVYPDGLGYPESPHLKFWNGGTCCGYASENEIDDVAFVKNLIDTLIADYSVNEDRIYATGMSNGAFLCYKLACELSNVIAAIAPVSGSMLIADCSPERTVPIIQFHSYVDDVVPHNGGVGTGLSTHYNPPVDSVFNYWSGIANCTIEQDSLYIETDYTHVKWYYCDCGSEIRFYITEDGGHSWPGGNMTILGDPVSTALNATDLIWDFFQIHALTCPPASLLEEELATFEMYPNPANQLIQIQSNTVIQSVEITNLLGTTVIDKRFSNAGKTVTIPVDNLTNGSYVVKVNGLVNSTGQVLIIE